MTSAEGGVHPSGAEESTSGSQSADVGGRQPPSAVLDAARTTVTQLLSALEERPERLRVSVAQVTIDLDWRALPTQNGSRAVAPAGEPRPGLMPDTQLGALSPAADARASAEPPVPPRVNGTGKDHELRYVCAPSVGTFYHAPQPGAAPFVTEGALVSPGQQVGIIEAMKLMLPVETEHAGRVAELLVANGTPVEYGEQLVALSPASAG